MIKHNRRVYIASPYTVGDVAVNVKTQLDVANELADLGYFPFAPLLFHFQHMAHPRPYEDWINQGVSWLLCCDALLRLPGESKGADNEEKIAKLLNIPIFYSVEELSCKIKASRF